MRVELIYPPLTDPTSGYHSLSYLAAYAKARGYPDIHLRDANIEAFHHSLACLPDVVAAARQRRAELFAAGPCPDSADEVELTELLTADLVDAEELARAVRILQSPEDFYDYRRYRWAVERITAWMHLLGASGAPGRIRNGFALATDGRWNSCSTADLSDHAQLARLNRPFERYYLDRLLPSLAAIGPDVVGINVTYVQQLPYALWMGYLIRQAGITDWLVCGGTEVSDVWKYLVDKDRFFTVFDSFDAAVVGEGESEFVALLSAVERGNVPAANGSTLVHPRRAPTHPISRRPLLRVEPLADIPAPDYGDLPWDQYLSPHRFVYYSPTRGCYWNRCTFCDYGLNGDAPTSPWRQDKVPKIVDELAAISQYAQFVYFSVDVLAPAMQLRLAEELIARDIKVFWGAEIRLEKYWSLERCRTLRESGCVAVSVGFESACQRILDLIDKGTRTESVLRTIRNLHTAGIGVQIMGFTGFPTETLGEAMESVDFLDEHRDLWTISGLGEFELTSGAIVAKQPERFGVHNVRPRPGDDIHRLLLFDTDVPLTAAELDRLNAAKRRLHCTDLDRPWLGGIDTPHTYFYHARYGTRMPEIMGMSNVEAARRHTGRWILNGRLIEARPGYRFVRGDRGERLRRGDVGGERWALQRADGRLVVLGNNQVRFLAAIADTGDAAVAATRARYDVATARRIWSAAVRKRIVLPDTTPTHPPVRRPAHAAAGV